ncbi:MAG: hypothetical protein WCR21_10100, partial [Bacteroidota bacterium]
GNNFKPFDGTDPFAAFRNQFEASNKSNEKIIGSGGNEINFQAKPKKLIRLNTGLNSSQSQAIDLSLNKSLNVGDMVLHEKFGKGQISEIIGNWPETKAIITFEQSGNKNLLLKFAKLSRL